MSRTADKSRWPRPYIYLFAVLGVAGLTTAFVQLGGMQVRTALPFAGFDLGALGLTVVGYRPACLRLDLRTYGEIHTVCTILWSATLYQPGVHFAAWLGIPDPIFGFSVLSALLFICTLAYTAVFTREERAALRPPRAENPD